MPEADAPLRVLYVSSFGGFQGGGQHSLRLLIEHIARLGVTPVVVAPQEGDFLAAVRDRGCPTHVMLLPPLRPWTLPRVLRTVAAIRELLADERIDLIHTDGPRATLLYGRAARAHGCPLAFHIRVSEREPVWLERWLARSADALICVSSGAAERFRRFASGKIHVVPNGVDLEVFSPAVTPSEEIVALRRTKDDVLVGEIAFLTPRKAQDVLIQALARLPEKIRTRVRVVLVGEEEEAYAGRLRRQVKDSGLEENVLFLGVRSDIRPILAGLDIVALPSYSEGLPRTLLEAAAMARPVIASDVPGSRDVVESGRTGLLCRAGDSTGWADGLLQMVNDPGGREEMGVQGRRLVEEKYDVAFVAPAVLGIYRDLLRDSPL
jgi:glycosyltransferase involved in cell wall biosynthesis